MDYLFSPGSMCVLVRGPPQNVEKVARFLGGEESVESCHVSGCHGCFGFRFMDRQWSIENSRPDVGPQRP